MATTDKSQDRPFLQALASLGEMNSLANRSVVEATVRFIVGETIRAVLLAGRPALRLALVKKAAVKLARILLGDNPDYTPVYHWNEPGQIDEFCAKWCGSAETDPHQRMEHCVVIMFEELLELAGYAGTEGVLDEQWQFQFNGIIDKYVGLFMGIDLPSQALLSLGDREPDESEMQVDDGEGPL